MRRYSGFTLIELVIVIAILGILGGIAIPRYMDAQASARGSKILADMRTLESALTIYMVKNTISTADESSKLAFLTTSNPPYIAAIPKVPTGTAMFPKGTKFDFDSTQNYYNLYHQKGTGNYMIVLYDPGVPVTLPLTVTALMNY